MGWFWGSGSGKDDGSEQAKTNKKTEDPLAGLDKDLKDFLHQKSKEKTTAKPPKDDTIHPSLRPKASVQEALEAIPEPPSDEPPQEPKQTLPPFANPRYAELWKTYRPPSNGFGPSDDGLLTNIQHFKSRSAALGRAALENCAEFEYALQKCYRDRSRIYSTETMITGFCNQEVQDLQRCGDYNVGLLKTLGFMDAVGRGVPECELEKIQIRADRIYQEFLREERKEKEMQEAKARGEVVEEGPKETGEKSS